MKHRISNLLRKSGVAAMVLATAMALSAPPTVLAARGGGGHGFAGGGGHSFSGGGRSFGGGQHFSAPAPAYRGGGGYYRGGGGNYYRGGGYYRPGWGYGYGGPYLGLGFGYSYAPGCTPGYYDAWGRWIQSGGCAVAPYGYAPGY